MGQSPRPVWFSFLYRAALDAMAPGFGRLIGDSSDPVVTTYMVELVIVIYMSLGLLGTRRLRAKAQRAPDTTLTSGN